MYVPLLSLLRIPQDPAAFLTTQWHMPKHEFIRSKFNSWLRSILILTSRQICDQHLWRRSKRFMPPASERSIGAQRPWIRIKNLKWFVIELRKNRTLYIPGIKLQQMNWQEKSCQCWNKLQVYFEKSLQSRNILQKVRKLITFQNEFYLTWFPVNLS